MLSILKKSKILTKPQRMFPAQGLGAWEPRPPAGQQCPLCCPTSRRMPEAGAPESSTESPTRPPQGARQAQSPAPQVTGETKAESGPRATVHLPTEKRQACSSWRVPDTQDALLLLWAPWVPLFPQRHQRGTNTIPLNSCRLSAESAGLSMSEGKGNPSTAGGRARRVNQNPPINWLKRTLGLCKTSWPLPGPSPAWFGGSLGSRERCSGLGDTGTHFGPNAATSESEKKKSPHPPDPVFPPRGWK